MAVRPSIVFIHPLKTAGTSVRYMLLEEYGADAVAPIPVGRAKIEVGYPVLRNVYPLEHQKEINRKWAEDNGYKVVMSHYDFDIVRNFPGWEILGMVRDPVMQLRSLYQFMARGLRAYPDFTWRHSGFESWLYSAHIRPYLNNQTTYYSGHSRRLLGVALENIERVNIGIADRFRESVARWNRMYGWNLVVQKRNVSKNVVPLNGRLQNKIERLQAQDLVLYKKAVELFERSQI